MVVIAFGFCNKKVHDIGHLFYKHNYNIVGEEKGGGNINQNHKEAELVDTKAKIQMSHQLKLMDSKCRLSVTPPLPDRIIEHNRVKGALLT